MQRTILHNTFVDLKELFTNSQNKECNFTPKYMHAVAHLGYTLTKLFRAV